MAMNTNNRRLTSVRPPPTCRPASDSLIKVQTELGGRQAGLIGAQGHSHGFNVTLQGLKNSLQSTDYALAATEYSN